MTDAIRLVIHAPTPTALERARRNATNLQRIAPAAEVEIVVNATAVAAALDHPHASDTWLIVCGNTLAATGATAKEGTRIVDAAVLHIAQRQAQGWAYMRA